jgi:hypothetical protein
MRCYFPGYRGEPLIFAGTLLGALWVLLPFAGPAAAAIVGYRLRWSATNASAIIVSTAVVAALTTWAYTDIFYGSRHRSTETLVFLWFPSWGSSSAG